MSVNEPILTIPQQRASESLSNLINSYNSGELKHESDLLDRLTTEFSNLYSGLMDPLITPEKMRVDDLLRLSAIRKPMEQLDQDLTSGFNELNRLNSAIIATSNVCATERYGLDSLLQLAKDKINSAIAWTGNSDKTVLWNSDTFQSDNKINTEITTAFVNTTLGLVTLEVTGEQSLSDKISKISIQHVSAGASQVDGMAGNSLEISKDGSTTGLTQSSEPTSLDFAGAREVTYNPAAMFDSNPNTRFEWEKYLIPDTQPLTAKGTAWAVNGGTTGEQKSVFGISSGGAAGGITNGLGWKYTVAWPGEGDAGNSEHMVVTPITQDLPGNSPLRLSMEIQFKDPQNLSWIELLPYIPEDIDVTTLKSIQVSSDGSSWQSLLSNPIALSVRLNQPVNYRSNGIPVKDYQGTAVIPCPVKQVKSLRVELEQPQPYKTIIGHKFYLKTSQVTDTDAKWYGGSSTKTYAEHVRTDSPELKTSGSQNPGLFGLWKSGLSKQDTDVSTYYDTFKAFRYCIGIRELGLHRRTFAQTSSMVSKAHIFSGNITAATIIVSEIIPDGWDTSQDWVTYELSHDGTTWQSVKPLNTDGTVGSVVQFPATSRLFLRTTLSRPADRPTESPVIEYYAIEAIPEGTV